ncbi:hypothetical protein A3D55_01830 [Candidatus Jorgensenbacteria bacterium RIFCSPHIGHO2_02_FULL_45_20]|uniref:Type 4 fimbrial biogenesis protein PilX N-terminal domain-containing protein n=1 Tax=Candidatus Jorgensenbacteria bacterium RIFCSPHIGHO2_02_FULL_45_20 TaxID=1798470 RepID=A0A1F6BPX8_9BACT|nr:MAG: hypothetical protein A3D55_01830 [Candidatus Jorgensenbacteria bacterium RIFCSPHIGHO2_02_FULL_45_20]
MTLNNKEGSLMVESMVAASLIVVGLLGIFTLISRSASMNKNAEAKVVASYLAAEGIEVVKNIIDSNVEKSYRTKWTWNMNLSGYYEVQYDSTVDTAKEVAYGSERYLNFDKVSGKYWYGAGDTTSFRRTVLIQDGGGGIPSGYGNAMTVKSIVKWTEGGEEQTVFFEDVFTNWRAQTTPKYTYE